MKILKQENMPEAEYRAAEAINISSLKKMARSPAHYLAEIKGDKKEPIDAQIFGTLVHLAVLEPERLESEFVVRPEGMKFTTKEGKDWKAQQEKPILDLEERDGLLQIREKIQSHPVASAVLQNGKKEISVFRDDAETGLPLKGRIDCLTEDDNGFLTIADIKTTQDASIGEFARTIGKFRYDAQAAFYMDLVDAEFFIFIAVEKEPPYEIGVYNLDAESIENGRRSYRRWLQELKCCIDSGEFPGYPQDLQTISLPRWAKMEGTV